MYYYHQMQDLVFGKSSWKAKLRRIPRVQTIISAFVYEAKTCIQKIIYSTCEVDLRNKSIVEQLPNTLETQSGLHRAHHDFREK